MSQQPKSDRVSPRSSPQKASSARTIKVSNASSGNDNAISSSNSSTGRGAAPRRVSAPGRALQNIMVKSHNVSTRFIDAFRSKLEETLEEEMETKKKNRRAAAKSKSLPVDKVGDELAKLINGNSDFHYSSWTKLQSIEGCFDFDNTAAFRDDVDDVNDKDVHDEETTGSRKRNRALLSSRNWRVLKRWFRQVVLRPHQHATSWSDHCTVAQSNVKRLFLFLFYNKRFSLKGCFLLCVTTFIISLGFLTTAVSVVGLNCFQTGFVILCFILEALVDIEEVQEHKQVQYLWNHIIVPTVDVVDKSLLRRYRYMGREWNSDDFEWSDGKRASSSSAALFSHPIKDYLKIRKNSSNTATSIPSNITSPLWKIPPPSVKVGKFQCLDENEIRRPSWGVDTTKHIVAIDFCFMMLRDEALRMSKGRTKRKAKDYRRTSSEPIGLDATKDDQSTTTSQGHRISYTRNNATKAIPKDEDTKQKLQVTIPQSPKNPFKRFSFDSFQHQQWRLPQNSGQTKQFFGWLPENTLDEESTSSSASQLTSFGSIPGKYACTTPAEAIEVIRERNSSSVGFMDTSLRSDCGDTDISDFLDYASRDGIRNRESSDLDDCLDGNHSSPYAALRTPTSVSGRKRVRRLASPLSADESHESMGSLGSDRDLNWIDLGAEIGRKILSSEHVQRVMASQDTAARIFDIKETMEGKLGAKTKHIGGNVEELTSMFLATSAKDGGMFAGEAPNIVESTTGIVEAELLTTKSSGPIAVPVHSMWTSPAAVAKHTFDLSSELDDDDDDSADDNFIDSSDEKKDEFPEDGMTMISQEKQQRSPSRNKKFSLENLVKRNPLGRSRRKRVKRRPGKKKSPRNRQGSFGDMDRDSDETASTDSQEYDDFHDNNLQLSISVSHESLHYSDTEEANFRSPRNAESIEIVCDDSEIGQGKQHKVRQPHQFLPGVKVVVPLFPIQPGSGRPSKQFSETHFQMATVVSSKRIYVDPSPYSKRPIQHRLGGRQITNCLSVKVKLDKSFLRNGEFAEMTFRVMDEWGQRYVPKHSKVPLGSCVATSFGLGVLVGWRVEDDMHVVRSLWQRRGDGAACAYLRRDVIHSTIEAAVGFRVQTRYGRGTVMSYVDHGGDFRDGRYFVLISDEGRQKDHIIEMDRHEILSCFSATFIPVIEHIREAAQYQLQVNYYREKLTEKECIDIVNKPIETFTRISKYADILWSSFLRAIEEDKDFDSGLSEFITSIINFLERLDRTGDNITEETKTAPSREESKSKEPEDDPKQDRQDPGFWIMNDMFGGIFNPQGKKEKNTSKEAKAVGLDSDSSIHDEKKTADPTRAGPTSMDRAFSVIRTLMRTVAIAKAKCEDEPSFKIGLSTCYEFLIFIKTVLKVQQKNVSPNSLAVWKRAWNEIVSTFGPVKDRLEKIGRGIAERMQTQGKRAKVRLLRFVDTIVQDDSLLLAAEQGDWDRCAQQLELALVKAKIIDEENREHYHKTAQFLYDHFAAVSTKSGGAGARNHQKLLRLAAVAQMIASPQKSFLKMFLNNQFLDILERILVRVFYSNEKASRMISIHASNFHTLRHLRMLKDWTIAGKLWMPLVDAADAEFSWAVSKMPENAKDFMCPLSSLFSLCVVQFHKIDAGDLTKDWLNFLLEDEAVNIIHEIDMKLILSLESFSHDIKEMMVVLPYYPSIEDDFLNLMDEVDLDEFLKEASEAIDDAEKLAEFIREKATIAIERFLDYLPKMSIPVEKRDLGDGWVLTCRGEDGGDLTLSDVNIKRENLTCQVMGGDTIFFPMLGTDEDAECESTSGSCTSTPIAEKGTTTEASILDHIRDLLRQAQSFGCWQEGVGGVGQQVSDRYVSSALHGLPVSAVLNCGIELWRNLEIDDDELLEIAIKDVSYQIQLQKEREEGSQEVREARTHFGSSSSLASLAPSASSSNKSSRFASPRTRFNPRVDPTVLFLEMKKLTLHLEKFLFRIEKHERIRTIFDPVFEGCGSLTVKNVSIKLRVDCVKVCAKNSGSRQSIPALQLRELGVDLEKVTLIVRDTGADWILNKVVDGFSDNITQIMATNLNDQVQEQIEMALENINGYFEVNPELMLSLLGITMDDLEERVIWV